MIIKQLVCITLLSLPHIVNSTPISYFGYTLNPEQNIVRSGDLEWLQWNETLGLSVSDALSMYANEGWRVASVSEIATLLNNFGFGNFITDPYIYQGVETPWTQSELSTHAQFIELFGATISLPLGSVDDPIHGSYALYPADINGLINEVQILDDYTDLSGNLIPHLAEMSRAGDNLNWSHEHYGVALVSSTPVPLPLAIWQLTIALICLLPIKRRYKSN